MREVRENLIGMNHADYLKLKRLIRRFPSVTDASQGLNIIEVKEWYAFTEPAWATITDAIEKNPNAKAAALKMNLDVTPLVVDVCYREEGDPE